MVSGRASEHVMRTTRLVDVMDEGAAAADDDDVLRLPTTVVEVTDTDNANGQAGTTLPPPPPLATRYIRLPPWKLTLRIVGLCGNDAKPAEIRRRLWNKYSFSENPLGLRARAERYPDTIGVILAASRAQADQWRQQRHRRRAPERDALDRLADASDDDDDEGKKREEEAAAHHDADEHWRLTRGVPHDFAFVISAAKAGLMVLGFTNLHALLFVLVWLQSRTARTNGLDTKTETEARERHVAELRSRLPSATDRERPTMEAQLAVLSEPLHGVRLMMRAGALERKAVMIRLGDKDVGGADGTGKVGGAGLCPWPPKLALMAYWLEQTPSWSAELDWVCSSSNSDSGRRPPRIVPLGDVPGVSRYSGTEPLWLAVVEKALKVDRGLPRSVDSFCGRCRHAASLLPFPGDAGAPPQAWTTTTTTTRAPPPLMLRLNRVVPRNSIGETIRTQAQKRARDPTPAAAAVTVPERATKRARTLPPVPTATATPVKGSIAAYFTRRPDS